jgi:radical SAM protein with 4Fe4S-binding SPASM domain
MESHVHNYEPYLTHDLEATISRPWAPEDLLAVPLRQLEFHPSNRCNWRCVFCHGLKSASMPVVELKVYEAFVGSIPIGSIKSVIVSGQYTEPLLYPEISGLIRLLSQTQALIGLYTNGTFDLEPVLSDLFLNPRSYIVFNLPASRVQAVAKMANIAHSVAIDSLRSITDNLALVAGHQRKVTSPFHRIHINCEIFGRPGVEEEIHRLLTFLTQFDAPISVRLTCPVTPLYQLESRGAFVNQLELGMNNIRSVLNDWIHKFDGTNLTIREYLGHHTGNSFDHCFAMFDAMVIRADGGVSPCCYTANRAYDTFLLGNIAQSDFPTLRKSKSRLRFFESLDPKHACPICSKKDYEINERGQNIVCR